MLLKKTIVLLVCLVLASVVSAQTEEFTALNPAVQWTFNNTPYELGRVNGSFSLKKGPALVPCQLSVGEAPGVFEYNFFAQNQGNEINAPFIFDMRVGNFFSASQAEPFDAKDIFVPSLEPKVEPLFLDNYILEVDIEKIKDNRYPYFFEGNDVFIIGSFMVTDGLPVEFGDDQSRVQVVRMPIDRWRELTGGGLPAAGSTLDPRVNPFTEDKLHDLGGDWFSKVDADPYLPLNFNLTAEVFAGEDLADRANMGDPSGLLYGKMLLNVYPFLGKVFSDLAFYSGEGEMMDLTKELFFEVPVEEA
jgi:hypothetical protein